jgi:hypothetical protein
MSNPTSIDPAAPLSRPANLAASEIDGEMVILNLDSGHFFQLNQVGSRIWEALETPMTMAELCRAMEQRFDVDPDTCQRDCEAFVGTLSAHALVTVGPAAR